MLLKSFLSSPRPYKVFFFGVIIVQLLIVYQLPLMQMMNDSGWYFMNVHFVETGEYITESRYPSFDAPSQYYPFFGYSFFLFLMHKLAWLTGFKTALLIKFFQFLFYFISALIVRDLTWKLTRSEVLGYLAAICFVGYYPYFNYTTLVMSETYATFVLLLCIYQFTKFWLDGHVKNGRYAFVLAGYMILIKPVLLPVSLAMLLFTIIRLAQSQQMKSIMVVLPIVLFPLIQMTFSKVMYDNYKLQTGTGWHLWDRVVQKDEVIPLSSEAYGILEEMYANHERDVNYGYWWDVTKDLSEFGLSEMETQEICKDVALAGIAEQPMTYIGNSFVNSYENWLMVNQDIAVAPNTTSYFDLMRDFAVEPQHQPLTDQLLLQREDASGYRLQIQRINYAYAKTSNYINYLYHNRFVLFTYILIGVWLVIRGLRSRFTQSIPELIIWFAAFSVIFGSNLAEYPQARLAQPAVIFVVMAMMIGGYQFAVRIRSSN